MQVNTILKINLINAHKIIFHQTMMNTIIRIINVFPETKDLILTVLIHQIFSNHTHEMNKLDNLELTQQLTIKTFNNQNPVNTHSYHPTQMHNEISLPYYLQQHEITKSQLTNFSQMPQAVESLQMTMNPYLMGGSSITSHKPLMVFTGYRRLYKRSLSKFNFNYRTSVNTPLRQSWIHRRTALIQTTHDGAAQKWFSVLSIEKTSD